VAVAVFSATLAGCTSYTGSPAHQVQEWAAGAGVVVNDAQLASDVTLLRKSVAARAPSAMTTNCAGLSYDSGTAYDNLPTPDSAITNELNIAYTDFLDAGNACAAASSVTSARVRAALVEIASGLDHLERAGALLKRDGVS